MAFIEYPPLRPTNIFRSLEAKVPRKFARDMANRMRFGTHAPLSDEPLFVPLADVHATYVPNPAQGAPKFRRQYSGHVEGGDWDLSITPLVDSAKYLACRAHFVDGVAWQDTGLFERHLKIIAKNGQSDECRTLDDLKRRYDRIDALFETVKRAGQLRPRSTLPDRFRREHGGIFVHIDRNGRAIRSGGGEHRFAIARILNLPEIPVQPGVVHLDAVARGHLQRLRQSIFGDASGTSREN
ncbi:hypothetical protein [Phaeobacter sp. J2-8]|uniref:hypothetical protein n=1 Tax=Phaeobacter sp. J2-8 TaxID=2931394 RepID=UPI001FD1B640|nr:hypothetical protein [Phaeobacter sp. J2-8]MCJ7872514.1 hypothetical protein [Phaeobacter sp. J2-8]